MQIELWQDGESWDAYVAGCEAASHYHHWKWRTAICRSFGHQPYYLVAVEGGAIRGVLPLFLIRSRVFGTSLTSVPFFSYGGVLAGDPATAGMLLDHTAQLAETLRVDRVELRSGCAAERGWSTASSKVTMEVPLPGRVDDLWRRLTSRLRNKIRHAEKHGFAVEWGGIDRVPEFYPVFAQNMRNLGTPVYPQNWFTNLCECSPSTTEIVTLRSDRRIVAAAFLNHFRRTSEAPWICSVLDERRHYSSVFLYWTFLTRAISLGSTTFDLGRCTPGGGTHAFKQLWGCVERPLDWHYWPERVDPGPRTESRKFRVAIEIWKRLPLFLANSVGPKIVRSLP